MNPEDPPTELDMEKLTQLLADPKTFEALEEAHRPLEFRGMDDQPLAIGYVDDPKLEADQGVFRPQSPETLVPGVPYEGVIHSQPHKVHVTMAFYQKPGHSGHWVYRVVQRLPE